MKRIHVRSHLACLAILSWVCSALQDGNAAQFGDFTYEVVGDEITITAYPWIESDPITIPPEIEGKPVTRIGVRAFRWSYSTSISIPDTVTVIEESGFESCRNLTSLDLPDNLVSIGRLAFRGAPISTLEIPAGVTTISELAFFSCGNLTSLTLPPSLEVIEGSAFGACAGLPEVTFPASVEVIGPGAFLGCDGLTEVDIPSGVISIGEHAFSHCENLVAINVAPTNQDYQSVDGVLLNKSGTELIRCPEARTAAFAIPDGVQLIHDWAFLRCWQLVGLTLPASVATVGEWGFRECRTLTELTIPAGVSSIGLAALADCNKLTAFHVDSANPAFVDLEGVVYSQDLTRIVACPQTRVGHYEVVGTVTEVGPYAFYSCTSLTSVGLPPGLQSIGERAFRSCASVDLAIPAGVEQIGERSFSGCSQLRRADIPAGVTALPDKVFEWCSSLAVLTLPSTLTSIGADAFRNCNSLTGVEIPSRVLTIGEDAFFGCDNLVEAAFGGDAPAGGNDVFDDANPSFEILHLSGATGFDQQPWSSYPRRAIDQSAFPFAGWLIDQQQPYDADLSSDLNGDGVPLVLAYALNLDPQQNLRGKLPVPAVDGGELALSFYGAAPRVDYEVEVSENLTDWTTTGVSLSDLDVENMRTATATRAAEDFFMRLRVSLQPQ